MSVYADCALSFDVWNRSVLIGGSSWSVFLAMAVGLLIGGGDFSRGDIGHRGASLNSVGTVIFCGCGATMAVSEIDGFRRGVFAVDSALCTAALDGIFAAVALADRDGLGSWLLFLRLFPVLTVADLTVGLAGDGSRDGFGDAVFDGGCELMSFFVPGAGECEVFLLWVGDVVDGLADFEAILDGVACVISGAWLGFLSGLSSILSSSLGSASVVVVSVCVSTSCRLPVSTPGDGGNYKANGPVCVVSITLSLSYNNARLFWVSSGDDPQCSPSIWGAKWIQLFVIDNGSERLLRGF